MNEVWLLFREDDDGRYFIQAFSDEDAAIRSAARLNRVTGLYFRILQTQLSEEPFAIEDDELLEEAAECEVRGVWADE